jgi:hypothetical protein
VLRDLGATSAALDELLVYAHNPLASVPFPDPSLPLADEAHLADWDDYERESRAEGVVPALARRLVQLRFPVEAGMSTRDDYRAATRRGLEPGTSAQPVRLERPQSIELRLHPTAAGRIPILTIPDREDFRTLVRAFSCRNEPEPVPDSMGACIVSGLNNWDRVARHRRRFERALGGGGSDEAWALEFQRLKPQKHLYQDRFLLLSTGPYSALRAADVPMDEELWLAQSLAVRREHECFHYLTHRVFGLMRNHLQDELIADLVGLLAVTGSYDGGLARRFLGVEDQGRFRPGGRLANYRGDPPLSVEAFGVLGSLARRCIANLERAVDGQAGGLTDATGLARFALDLYVRPLEDLAADDFSVTSPSSLG